MAHPSQRRRRAVVVAVVDSLKYTRSKMKPGFQIVAGAYSSYVTRAIWKGIRSRFPFGMGIKRVCPSVCLGFNFSCRRSRRLKIKLWATHPRDQFWKISAEKLVDPSIVFFKFEVGLIMLYKGVI